MIVERPYKDDVIFNYFSILCNGLLDIGTHVWKVDRHMK